MALGGGFGGVPVGVRRPGGARPALPNESGQVGPMPPEAAAMRRNRPPVVRRASDSAPGGDLEFYLWMRDRLGYDPNTGINPEANRRLIEEMRAEYEGQYGPIASGGKLSGRPAQAPGTLVNGRAPGAGLSRLPSGPSPHNSGKPGFGRVEPGPAPAPPSGPPFDPRSLPPGAGRGGEITVGPAPAPGGRGPFAPGTTVYAPWGNNGQIENVPHVIGSGPGSYGNPGGNTTSTFPRPPAPGGPTMGGGPAPAPAPRPYPLPAPGADPSSAMQQSFMQFLQSGGR